MSIAIVVDWSGPFRTIKAAKEAAKEFGEVLYFATGKRAYQRETDLQYVGISVDGSSRFNSYHKNLPLIKKSMGIWIGEVVSHAVAGRRAAKHPVKHSVVVELAEWGLAYFLELHLNDRKRSNAPPQSFVLVNRWFRTDFETRRVHRGHENWPDLIEYEHPDDGDGGAVIVWFGSPGRRDRLSGPEVTALKKSANSST